MPSFYHQGPAVLQDYLLISLPQQALSSLLFSDALAFPSAGKPATYDNSISQLLPMKFP